MRVVGVRVASARVSVTLFRVMPVAGMSVARIVSRAGHASIVLGSGAGAEERMELVGSLTRPSRESIDALGGDCDHETRLQFLLDGRRKKQFSIGDLRSRS